VKRTSIPIAFALWTLSASGGMLAVDQTTDRKNPDLVIRSVAGRDLFEFYCAPCHGRDGKGAGYVAPALQVKPPDLTRLTERNRGTFPAERIEAVLRGETHLSTPAHGSSEMPVWGPIFKGLDNRDEVNAARIENLVKYLESIQARAKADLHNGAERPAGKNALSGNR
jgi:mono/diheme cytochrome c family protein